MVKKKKCPHLSIGVREKYQITSTWWNPGNINIKTQIRDVYGMVKAFMFFNPTDLNSNPISIPGSAVNL